MIRETYYLLYYLLYLVVMIHDDPKKYARSKPFSLVAEDVFWLLCSGREPKSSPRRLSGPDSLFIRPAH